MKRARTAPAKSEEVHNNNSQAVNTPEETTPAVLDQHTRVPLSPLNRIHVEKRKKRNGKRYDEAEKDREVALKRFDKKSQRKQATQNDEIYSHGESFSTVTPIRPPPVAPVLRRSTRPTVPKPKFQPQETRGMFGLGVRAKQYAVSPRQAPPVAKPRQNHNAFSDDQFFDLPRPPTLNPVEMLRNVSFTLGERNEALINLELASYQMDEQLEQGIKQLDELLDSQMDEKRSLFFTIGDSWLN